MKLLVYAALLAVAGSLAACHHRDPEGVPYDLTGRYYLSNTLSAAKPIRLFAQQGEVTDPARISRFLAHWPGLRDNFSATDQPLTGGKRLLLRFTGNGRATYFPFFGGPGDSVQVAVSDQQAGSFQLQRLDSTTYLVSAGGLGCAPADALDGYLTLAVPGKTCHVVSPATGYSSSCRVRGVSVIGAHGPQLYLPFLSWQAIRGGCSAGFSGTPNLLNDKAYTRLSANDTLVVQEREIALIR